MLTIRNKGINRYFFIAIYIYLNFIINKAERSPIKGVIIMYALKGISKNIRENWYQNRY